MGSPIVDSRSKDPPRVVAIGASAGGIEPLLQIVRDLPADLPATVLVVVHVPARGKSLLPEILTRSGKMQAHHAVDGEILRAGTILVAPPDHHLTIDGRRAVVRRGPMVNRSRPAIDPLFQSVAIHVGRRAVGVILSGALDDGAAGMAAIAMAGGVTIVQDPDEAVLPSMPEAAIERADVKHRLRAELIGPEIIQALGKLDGAVDRRNLHVERLEQEVSIVELSSDLTTEDLGAKVSVYGCPDCGGTLWELNEDDEFRFRCRIGHAYSPRTLLDSQDGSVEDALWIAVRALDEQTTLANRLAQRARDRGHDQAASRFDRQALRAETHASTVRELLRLEPASAGDDGELESLAAGE